MRFAAYAGTSTVLATAVIIRALHQRANFYSACVYLAQSNACLMVLTNLLLLGIYGLMYGLQKLLYGPLRPIEIEQLYEKAWFAITETCLAMTIFREELGAWFVVMFVSLLIGKVWGWIGDGRLEILEQQPPANPRLFHARLSISLLLSIAFEVYMFNYSVQTVRRQARPTMMVMFAFEFAVLTVTSASAFARYAITLYEAAVIKRQISIRLDERRLQLRQEREAANANAEQSAENVTTQSSVEDDLDEADIDVPGWEDKGRWVFYLDLATDFFKLCLYLTFFTVLCMFYGMPIHIIRDVALTIRSFYKRLTDFLRYRNATRDMNLRYADATPAEIQNEDVCIICREAMRAWPEQRPQNGVRANEVPAAADLARGTDERLRPKKLPCGHILHFACLRSWLERQQNCPTCRRPVLVTSPNPSLGQPQNGQIQANGQPNAGNQGGNLQAVALQNGVRMYGFGPFRIGLGDGQNIQNFAQQIQNNPQIVQQQAPANAGANRQPLGFGSRFRRSAPTTAATQNTSRSGQAAVQGQIQQIEQQLMHEINSLRMQADQLNLVRALQGELARLRIAQAHNIMGHNGGNPTGTQSTTSALNTAQVPSQNLPALPTVQTFTVNEAPSRPNELQPQLGTTSRNLPPGVTLPEGWTLLPLQRLPNNPGMAIPAGTWQQHHTNLPRPHQSPATSHNSNDVPTYTHQPFRSEVLTPSGDDPLSSTHLGSMRNSSFPAAQSNTLRHNQPPISTAEQDPRESSSQNQTSEDFHPPTRADLEPSEKKSEVGSEIRPSASNVALGEESDIAAASSSTAYKEGKGKGKATTIEDATDDVD